MLLSVENFEQSLEIVKSIAPMLGFDIPRLAEERHLEIYKWLGAEEQEVIAR